LALISVEPVLPIVKNRFAAGILVVFCLDVCFMAFGEFQRVDDRFFHSGTIASVWPPVQYPIVPVAEMPIGDDYFDDPVPAVGHNVVTHQAQSARPAIASLRPERVQKPLFEPIRITYPSRTAVALTYSPAAFVQESTTISAPDSQKSEVPRRNEQSVVTRVVKKPYEFLKFVGSKLK
jgi:hypothetical protein